MTNFDGQEKHLVDYRRKLLAWQISKKLIFEELSLQSELQITDWLLCLIYPDKTQLIPGIPRKLVNSFRVYELFMYEFKAWN